MAGATRSVLRGCIPIVCTPFGEDGSLDVAGLAAGVEWVIGEGAAGVAGLAIASEGYKLTEGERDRVAAVIVETVGGRVPVVLSAAGAGTEVAVERARRAVAIGADAVMVLPPSFVRPSRASLLDYYLRVGAEIAPATLVIQDAPQLTGVAMGPDLWAEIARDAAGPLAIKVEGTPQGGTISAARLALGDEEPIFCGWGGLGILDALERGAAGSMPAPNMTATFVSIQRAWEGGDREGAAAVFGRELPFLSWTMQSVDHSVAAAKEELRRRGVFASSQQRQPATALDEVGLRQLAHFLDLRLDRG
ncbi:MAG: dihydrodipicolinate synthase family protein [Chloroflexia bacterium]|nr:dihydrodipicolinate synthase family protein [Chloroflexia bacterium]